MPRAAISQISTAALHTQQLKLFLTTSLMDPTVHLVSRHHQQLSSILTEMCEK